MLAATMETAISVAMGAAIRACHAKGDMGLMVTAIAWDASLARTLRLAILHVTHVLLA